MKIKKTIIILIMLSVIIIGMNTNNITKAENITEEKIYCNATLDDEFTDNEILIVITNEESIKFREYTVNSFSEINCIEVIDLTDGYEEKIEQQLNGTYEGNMPVNLETFNRILKLTLGFRSKEYVLSSIKELEKRNDIKSAEPNYNFKDVQLSSEENGPNDYYYNNAYIDSEGEEIDSAWVYEAINMEEAWSYYDEINYEDKSIVNVGVIDAGVYGGHIDLNSHINISSSSCCSTDFFDPLSDEDGHGTRVAGIIAAYRGNQIGIAGVCQNARIVSLRVTNNFVENFIECLEYAEDENVRIINCSRGWDTYSSSLQTAIANYSGLLICGAGNSGNNNDTDPVYPASYPLDNIISVGSSNENNNQCTYAIDIITASNYGLNSVDLFAPGKNIVSTYKDGGYNAESGTSFAAPFVTGVAAMILSIDPNLSIWELKSTILSNVTPATSLTTKCVTGGVLNAEAAIKNIHYHNYVYVYDSALYHRGECSCGATNIEVHSWRSNPIGGNICIKCGGTSLALYIPKKEEENE